MKSKKISISLLVVWSVSYLLLFIIPTILCFTMYQKIRIVMQNEIQASNMLTLKSNQFHTDKILLQMDNIAYEVNYSQDVLNLQLLESPLAGPQRYELIETVGKLNLFIKTYETYDSCLLYVDKFDMLVSNTSIVPTATYYQILFKNNSQMSYYQFKDMLVSEFSGDYLKIKSKNKEYLAYFKTLPLHLPNAEKFNFILMMDIENIRSELTHSNNWVAIIRPNAEIITQNNVEAPDIDMSELTFSDISGTLEKGKYVISYTKSDITNFYYVSASDKNYFWNDLQEITNLTFGGFIGCLILAIILIILLMRLYYRPLQEILIRKNFSNDKKTFFIFKEYADIYHQISWLHKQKSETDSTLYRFQNQYKTMYLNNLFTNAYDNKYLVKQIQSVLGMHFDKKKLTLTLFEVENVGKCFQSEFKKDFQKGNAIMGFIIHNILQDLAPESVFCYTLYQNFVLVLFHYDNSDAQELHESCEQAVWLIEEKFETRLLFWQDKERSDPLELPQAVKDVLKAREATNREMQDKSFSTGMITIIQQQYSNPDLCVSFIAGQLFLSSGYVSKRFKTEQNINLLEYINLYRIEQSKVLMQDIQLSLEKISEMVGYTNYRTYARVFVSLSNMSPREFRAKLNLNTK